MGQSARNKSLVNLAKGSKKKNIHGGACRVQGLRGSGRGGEFTITVYPSPRNSNHRPNRKIIPRLIYALAYSGYQQCGGRVSTILPPHLFYITTLLSRRAHRFGRFGIDLSNFSSVDLILENIEQGR